MDHDGLFLDFDGVVCDSLNECYVSSWIAFHERYRGDQPASIALVDYRRFCELRRFVRAGKDYILLQEMIAEGLDATSQEEFDSVAARVGDEKLATYDSLLYAVREDLIAKTPQTWLGLNRAYGCVGPRLLGAAQNERVWIISTKRPAFITRILRHWGIDFDERRIIFPDSKSKIEVIVAAMAAQGYASSLFVDDQPDHLRNVTGSGIECRFATWAHGRQVPQAPAGAAPISLQELCAVLDGLAE